MKSQLRQDGPEKTFALAFDTGEEVAAGLLQFARDYKLSGSHSPSTWKMWRHSFALNVGKVHVPGNSGGGCIVGVRG